MDIRITGGAQRGRRLRSTLRFTKGADLRPTSDFIRGAIFSILGSEAVQGARVLDLYAGTGALGIEAMSRGAASADFVEANARLAQQIRENLRQLSMAERSRVFQARLPKGLDALTGGYDLVFADPPYEMQEWEPLMDRLSSGGMIVEKGLVVAEHRFTTTLAQRYGVLAQLSSRRHGDTAVTIFRAGAAGA